MPGELLDGFHCQIRSDQTAPAMPGSTPEQNRQRADGVDRASNTTSRLAVYGSTTMTLPTRGIDRGANAVHRLLPGKTRWSCRAPAEPGSRDAVGTGTAARARVRSNSIDWRLRVRHVGCTTNVLGAVRGVDDHVELVIGNRAISQPAGGMPRCDAIALHNRVSSSTTPMSMVESDTGMNAAVHAFFGGLRLRFRQESHRIDPDPGPAVTCTPCNNALSGRIIRMHAEVGDKIIVDSVDIKKDRRQGSILEVRLTRIRSITVCWDNGHESPSPARLRMSSNRLARPPERIG
jgi:hypothetical protein